MIEIAVIERRETSARITLESGWAVIRVADYAQRDDLDCLTDAMSMIGEEHRRIEVDLHGEIIIVSGFFGLLVRHCETFDAEIRLRNVSPEVREFYWFKGYFSQCEAGVFELIDRDTPVLVDPSGSKAAGDGDDADCSDAETDDAAGRVAESGGDGREERRAA